MKNVFKNDKLIRILPSEPSSIQEKKHVVGVELPVPKDEVVVEGNVTTEDFSKVTLVKGQIVVKK